jgi:N-acyl-phosphatidylethanolamine-hydrolysing phospholipase D
MEAAQLHRDLKARTSLAMHWGTFRLSDEPWEEPLQLLADARRFLGLAEDSFRAPKLGETIRL